jgi:hypothetical protein
LFARLLTLADVAPKPLKSQSLLRQRSVRLGKHTAAAHNAAESESLLRQRSVRLFTFGGAMVFGLRESQSLLRQRSVP